MKLIYFAKIFLVLVSLFLISCSSDKTGRAEEVESVRNTVVSFTMRGKDKSDFEKLNYGSGFFVSEKHILTALHVSSAIEADIKKYNFNGDFETVVKKLSSSGREQFLVPVKLVAKDAENDLAVYEFDIENLKSQWRNFSISPLPIDEKLPNVSDEILLTGYFAPYTQPFSSIGTVSMITQNKFDINGLIFNQAIFSDLTSIPGHSGGPLYSFRTKKIVGVNTRSLNPNNDSSRISISTNSLHVKKLLDSLNLRTQQNQ